MGSWKDLQLRFLEGFSLGFLEGFSLRLSEGLTLEFLEGFSLGFLERFSHGILEGFSLGFWAPYGINEPSKHKLQVVLGHVMGIRIRTRGQINTPSGMFEHIDSSRKDFHLGVLGGFSNRFSQ